MSRSQVSLDALARTRRTVAEIQSTDVHGAVLTLTRTSDLAITTAGTIITWQQEVRRYQVAWAGTVITIPSSGWYIISVSWATSAAVASMIAELYSNGVVVQDDERALPAGRNVSLFLFMRYFATGDAVQIAMRPSANVNLLARPENGNIESPLLNIVQLSGGINV